MISLIAGASHTGKTKLAQDLLEKRGDPYLSLDLLKMGLIRSGQTELTPVDDEALVPYLWSIAREIIKTAIDNGQNLIVEGIYIPFDWQQDFSEEYLRDIRYVCLVMSRAYLESKFDDVSRYACVIERRIGDDVSQEELIADNERNLRGCIENGLEYVLIDGDYDVISRLAERM